MKAIVPSVLRLALCAVVSAAGACQSTPDPTGPGMMPMPTPMPGPTVSQMVGTDGGMIALPQLGGATLQVPAGALPGDTMITVTMGDDQAQPGETALSPSLRFLPDGLQFGIPASLTLPFQLGTLSPDSELVLAATSGGQRTDIAGGLLNLDFQASTLSANIDHFTDYQVLTTGHPLPPINNDVDILFMIDNSPSMSPKQNALAQNIPRFIQRIEALGVNYHIGITTSDVGTETAPGASWGGGLGTACEKFAGDDGTLQRIPCTLRSFGTQAGQNACASLCPDPKFVPAAGAGYISKVAGVTNVPALLAPDPNDATKMIDIGPQRAFQCMALVGDTGCGIEGSFEGARRAVDGHNAQNNGFLRPNSVLVVVFITDEDDCSVQIARRNENDPNPATCTPGNPNAGYACFNPDYRCLARSVTCTETLDTPGTKTTCKERTDSYLEPVSKYVNFFAALRPTNRLFLSGIWTVPALNRPGGKFVVQQKDATRGTWGLNRATDSTAGCVSATDSTVFGQAQLRLTHFKSEFNGSLEVSICDIASYPSALDNIAAAIARKMGP